MCTKSEMDSNSWPTKLTVIYVGMDTGYSQILAEDLNFLVQLPRLDLLQALLVLQY